ncbi:transcriptional regulator [Staphylococcus sp. 11261D007BR]
MGSKVKRVLSIYSKLLNNNHVNVKELSKELEEHPRSIQRDLEDIRSFLRDNQQLLLYEHKTHNYYVSDQSGAQNNENVITATFEMTYQLYQLLKQQYNILRVKSKANSVEVKIQITPSSAINLCFMYRKSVRLISPDYLFGQFTTEFIKLQMIYMTKSF